MILIPKPMTPVTELMIKKIANYDHICEELTSQQSSEEAD